MDAGQEDSEEWQPFQPETLVQGLRCPVCLDYFVRPHTLACGHTFCLRCLRTLARLTRHARERIPLERLKFRCPSCRKFTPARPILRRRAAINYAIKELVDDWFQSPYSIGSVDSIVLRSVGSQTLDESEPTENVTPSSSCDELDKSITKEEYREVLFHRIPPKKDFLDKDVSEKLTTTSASVDESSQSEDNEHLSSDEESSDVERFTLQVVEDQPPLRLSRILSGRTLTVAGALRLVFEESRMLVNGIRQSRSRMALTLCWFLYGVAVVYISHAFLPWMCFYTMIYFLILYAEMSQPAFFRG